MKQQRPFNHHVNVLQTTTRQWTEPVRYSSLPPIGLVWLPDLSHAGSRLIKKSIESLRSCLHMSTLYTVLANGVQGSGMVHSLKYLEIILEVESELSVL